MRLTVFVACLCLVACSDEARPPLTAADIVINEPMPGMSMTAAYLTLRNNSAAAIAITRVSSSDFEAVEMHESVVEDGIAKMRQIDTLTIPPNATIKLQPGGIHLMLLRRVAADDKVELQFYGDNTILLSVVAPLTPRSN